MAKIATSLGTALGIMALIALPACSKKTDDTEAPAAKTAEAGPAANTTTAAVAPTDVATLTGVKFADYKGTAAAGEKVAVVCKTCHAFEAGKNMIGPSLWGIQGRNAGTVAGYSYSAANKGSGIVWSDEKLFQYLEAPQRVVVGTKMSYTGIKDPQQRADLIAYLNTLK